MAERVMKENIKGAEIAFRASIEFKGPANEFEKVMDDLAKLRKRGLMIDTVPLPEKKVGGMMIDTVPLPELGNEGLMIGTWPTPERKASRLMIDTVPLPERPFPGIPAITKLLTKEMLNKLVKGMPKVRIIKDINGGMRNPHLHVGNEVVLLDRAKFKELVGQVAAEMAKGWLRP